MTLPQPTFESLQLIPGQPLQLELDGHKRDRDRSTLVGYRPGGSILVTTPTLQGRPVPIKLETGLNVRLFANRINGVCAFRSQVIYIATLPFAHLHLAIPERLVIGEIRKAVRARVKLAVAMVHDGERVSAEMLDMSVDGGRARLPVRPVDSGDRAEIKMRLKVGRLEKILRLKAIIRSVAYSLADNQSILGLQWQDVSEDESIALQAFVLERLHENPY